MPRALRLTLLAAIPITLLVLLPIGGYTIDRSVSSGNVPRNISVDGVEIGGATPEDAQAIIETYEQELQTLPATVVVEATEFELRPTSVALRADVNGAVEQALEQRSHGFVAGFIPWVASFGGQIELDLDWSLDTEALEEHFAEWERQAITNPAYEGAVSVAGTRVLFEYPAVGNAIDRPPAAALIASALTSPVRSPVVLSLVETDPSLTRTDIDEAVAMVERMLSRPAVLTDVGRGAWFVLTREQLGEAIRVDIIKNSAATINLSLNQQVVASYLAPVATELSVAPVDVAFDIDRQTNTVSTIPSKNGLVVDPAAATEALFVAATTGLSQAIPYRDGSQPLHSTEASEAWGPLGLVSEFTTTMPGVERVHNIKLMADTIDGHVVWPGEEFSINDKVGKRTEEGGYLRDGAIIKGDVSCCGHPANVGGGVSQYGTTFYNAVFFGCYEDILHQPHSLHISRYPEGREATLGYPLPDVRFRNDTDAPVIIRNSYTDNTITVQFYGNDGGRVCTAEKGERFSYTNPKTVYEANAAVEPGTEVLVAKGSRGFSVTVTRVMTMPDGRVMRQPFTHRYRAALRKYDKNPCDLFASIDCPVEVPAVVGLTVGKATAELDAAGFLWSVTYEPNPDKVGIVLSASHGGKQQPGITIALIVGE